MTCNTRLKTNTMSLTESIQNEPHFFMAMDSSVASSVGGNSPEIPSSLVRSFVPLEHERAFLWSLYVEEGKNGNVLISDDKGLNSVRV